MGLGQWIIIIILVAIIIFGFSAVISFLSGAFHNVYPAEQEEEQDDDDDYYNKDEDGLIVSTVIRVIDGDTIQLAGGEKIRLALINTPERGEYGFQAAKEWMEYRCLGKEATVDLDRYQKQSYDRLIGLVFCDGYNMNVELWFLHLAFPMLNYCKVSEFKDSEICTSNNNSSDNKK